MGLIQNLISRVEILVDLLSFFWHRKWWWITPILVILLLLSLVVIFTRSSAIAPFIYTPF